MNIFNIKYKVRKYKNNNEYDNTIENEKKKLRKMQFNKNHRFIIIFFSILIIVLIISHYNNIIKDIYAKIIMKHYKISITLMIIIYVNNN